MTELSKIDFEQQANDRLLTQYSDSENLKKLLGIMVREYGLVDAAAIDVINHLSIDEAEGDLLDKLGERVGQARVLANYEQFQFFGFDGSETYPNVGGFDQHRFRDNEEPLTGDVALSDPEYRQFIRARIFRNHVKGGRPEELLDALEKLFGVTVDIHEGVASISFHIARKPTSNDNFLARRPELLPKAGGITITHITAGTDVPFGFDGWGLNKGFDEGEFVEVIYEKENP